MSSSKPTSIALYGGTFDPPHLGHLLGASDALEQLKLSRLIFIPCALSPHKLNRCPAAGLDRYRMLKASIKGMARMEVSDVEIKRQGPSYAIETILHFGAKYPGSTLYWIVGADQLPKLHTWERFSEIKKRVVFLVLSRPGSKTRFPQGVIGLPQPRWIDISSTEIRNRVKNKQRIDWMVPAAVERHICRHRLYNKKT